jgi:general secretion pathway protein D
MEDKQGILSKISLIFAFIFFLYASPLGAESKKVTFNFVDVDLATVTKFISDVTGKNFIFDERVKGGITIIAPTQLDIEDAYNLFTSVLELKGFTVVPSGTNAYKIIPSVEAKQKGIRISSDMPLVNETYIVRLMPLKNITSSDAVRLLQPVVSKDGHIAAFEPGNLILLVDSGLNVEKVLSIIEIIDQPPLGEEPEIVFLKHASAEAVAEILNEGAQKASRTPGQPVMEAAKAVADKRLNAAILFGDKASREAMKRLVSLLDVPSEEAQGGINVYFLENADAEELAKVLQNIIRTSVGGAAKTPQPAPLETSRGIVITPDKATNSLIIVGSQSDYQSILKVIKQLDKRSRQVFVEAMIVEASIDKLRELGAKWRVIGRDNGEPVVVGGVGIVDTTTLQSVVSGLTGLTAGGMGNFFSVPVLQQDGTRQDITVPGFAALLSLNEFKDAVNVLSTPQILTSDNKEAEIVVGENVPFISKRESDPARAASVFSTIERKDVGITLRITPQITEGDYVKLDIYQEISALKQESENILISVGPTTTKRSTKTTVIAKDSQTVIIGGLMQEREEEALNKVPVFGDIPLLGWLFKQKSVSKKKTNLIVFLTPHIVKDADKLLRITEDKKKEFAKGGSQYAGGELLVKFKEGTSSETVEKSIKDKGAYIIKIIGSIYHLGLKEGQSVEDAVKEFSSMPGVEYAEPNYRLKMQ